MGDELTRGGSLNTNFLFGVFLLCFGSWGSSAETCGYEQTIQGPFRFSEVELVSKAHAIGLYRGGEVTLNPWIEISDNAYLGIDPQGRLLNVLQVGPRTVAYVLSGDHKIKDVFYRKDGLLLAIDGGGRIFTFDWSLWEKPQTREIIYRALKRYGLTLCNVGALLMAYAWSTDSSLFAPESLASMGLAVSSGFFIEGFRAILEFEKQNEITDGLVPTKLSVDGYRLSDFVRDSKGVIVDYALSTASGVRPLSELIEGHSSFIGAQNFDLKCEHFLLPTGINPGNYEP